MSVTTGKSIPDRAAKLRARELGSTESAKPTPLIDIAHGLGYSVVEFKPEEEMRHIVGAISHDPKVIYVNEKQLPMRKRFTIAHEIGHAVLHAGEVQSDGIVDYRHTIGYGYGEEDKERDANEFAASLLMPQGLFESLWNAYRKNVSDIAEHLRVSREAVKVRASKLGLK